MHACRTAYIMVYVLLKDRFMEENEELVLRDIEGRNTKDKTFHRLALALEHDEVITTVR